MPFLAHWAELRARCIGCVLAWCGCFALCYVSAGWLYDGLMLPLAKLYAPHQGRMIYTGLAEGFLTHVTLAAYGASFIVFPYGMWQIYRFILPGLTRQERKIWRWYMGATPLLFWMGVGICYAWIFPMAWSFFMQFQTVLPGAGAEIAYANVALPIVLEPRVGEYLSLSLQLMFAFGVAFEMPVALTLLMRFGVITPALLRRSRRVALVLILVVAALLTPPDVVSQIGLALPLWLLYECSIIVGERLLRKPS